MSRIAVLWDIDDTLSVHGAPRWSEEYKVNSVSRDEQPSLFKNLPETVDSMQLRMSGKLVRELSKFDQMSEIENHWLTAWEGVAPVFASKMGMTFAEQWPSIRSASFSSVIDENRETKTWWKTSAVRLLLDDNPETRVIWIDDMLDHTERIESDNQKLVDDFPDRLLLVGVLPHYGVTPDVLSFIIRAATVRWRSGLFIFEG